MGILIFLVLLLIFAVIVIVSAVKVTGAIIDIAVGLCRLLWALGTLIDKMFESAVADSKAEARAAQLPPQATTNRDVQRDLRLVVNNVQGTNA